jgi:heterotetrameric sarcosine oxidase gamma subunit
MPELVTRLPPRASVRLQVASRLVQDTARHAIGGVSLPQHPNRWNGQDPLIWRVAPDAWLIQSAQAGHDVASMARAACRDLDCAVTDLSDALETIALDGPAASAVLARGCGLDLREKSFEAQACARTRLAQLPVLMRKAASARFELVVDRAAAQYLEDWLRDAAIGVG